MCVLIIDEIENIVPFYLPTSTEIRSFSGAQEPSNITCVKLTVKAVRRCFDSSETLTFMCEFLSFPSVEPQKNNTFTKFTKFSSNFAVIYAGNKIESIVQQHGGCMLDVETEAVSRGRQR